VAVVVVQGESRWSLLESNELTLFFMLITGHNGGMWGEMARSVLNDSLTQRNIFGLL